jgi:Protein of unknown function (DUF4245)
MTGDDPLGQRPQDDAARGPAAGAPTVVAPPPAVERANRMTAANMLRSLLPVVVICLLLVFWQSLQEEADKGVRVVDPASAVQLAAARASYPVPTPAGLDADYRPTSARTDAGEAGEGDPVTLEIGYLTPSEEFAGFVVSDDRRAAPLRAVLDEAEEQGTVEVGGETWTRSTTARDETALVREADGVTVVVTGSASDDELAMVAAAVEPYAG